MGSLGLDYSAWGVYKDRAHYVRATVGTPKRNRANNKQQRKSRKKNR